jgi:hypothetical protein
MRFVRHTQAKQLKNGPSDFGLLQVNQLLADSPLLIHSFGSAAQAQRKPKNGQSSGLPPLKKSALAWD